jgi:hypothetical protein
MEFPNGLDGMPYTFEIPILGKLMFEAIEWEIGQVAVVEEGGGISVTGVIIRFWFPALPWFKFQIPFARLEARNLIRALEEKLDEQAPEISDQESA